MSEHWHWWEVCLLALVIWREARGESPAAQVAVGCSIRNRVQHPKWWGTDYVTVITKKWQYSSIAGRGDPQLTVYPQADDFVFESCLQLADDVIAGRVASPATPGADSYYDVSIAAPPWATPQTRVGQIGRLIFHNLDRDVEAESAA